MVRRSRLLAAGSQLPTAKPSPPLFAGIDIATRPSSCAGLMPSPLLPPPAYNWAEWGAIFQTRESCMTDPAHREIRVCFPWIRPRSDSKLRGWPGSRGRRKKRDGRAAHHTSREARRRSCPFGGCEHDRRHHGGPRRLERACQAPRRRNALKYTHLPFMAAADPGLAKRAKGGSGRQRRTGAAASQLPRARRSAPYAPVSRRLNRSWRSPVA